MNRREAEDIAFMIHDYRKDCEETDAEECANLGKDFVDYLQQRFPKVQEVLDEIAKIDDF